MDHMELEGYQPKKKVRGGIKLPKGGFGLEKAITEDRPSLKDKESPSYGKLPNGATLVKPCDRTPPPPPKQPKSRQRNSDLWINQPISCHSCKHKDICKYMGDYLEQVVHIIDTYDGVFELNCCHYEKESKENWPSWISRGEDLKPKSFKLKEKVEFRVTTDNEVYIYNDYLKALLKASYLDEDGIKCKISRVCVKSDGSIMTEDK